MSSPLSPLSSATAGVSITTAPNTATTAATTTLMDTAVRSTISTTSTTSTISKSSTHALQKLLPTCPRCRRLRRKCDTQLPNCRSCHRAGVECTIFDHSLKQTLPRAYVQSLLTRVEHLEAVQKGTAPETTTGSSGTAPPAPPNDFTAEAAAATAGTAATAARPVTTPSQPVDGRSTPAAETVFGAAASYDVIVPPTTASSGKSRYWGASSIFALTVEILHHAITRQHVSAADVLHDDDTNTDMHMAVNMDMDDEQQVPYTQSEAPEADIRALLQLYLVSANTLYGFVDPEQVQADLDVYLAIRQQQQQQQQSQSPTSPPPPLGPLGVQAHPYFRTAMMCAIACATRARYRPQRTAESLAYYADAVTYVEEVTAEVAPASLQALLLLIVFCLFFPRKGDVWKLLDYACRLAIELGYHTEDGASYQPGHVQQGQQGRAHGADHNEESCRGTQENAQNAQNAQAPGEHYPDSDRQIFLRRSTFWGLYAIERIVGQLFGRGSDLPETIITAAYPYPRAASAASSSTGIHTASAASSSATALASERTTLQAMSIAHHYRLVYLRSEIFRSMYLPARPSSSASAPDATKDQDHGIAWLREQYATLLAWRHELVVPDSALEGVATVTCDVGYDATMCFLFQPLLLAALRRTGTCDGDAQEGNGPPSTAPSPPLLVASDPFYSSIHLIRTYEKVIRAPEHSALGSYPMTFMSAHYIYLASITLLAHALLRLDGRTQTLRRMSEMSDVDNANNTTEIEELDWGAYVDVSSSCLVLLAWCGERWPGMLGMFNVYQQLFRRTVRALISRGLVR